VREAAERARTVQEFSHSLMADHAVLHEHLQATLDTIHRGRAARDAAGAEAPPSRRTGSL
jgi:hypothetical protein